MRRNISKKKIVVIAATTIVGVSAFLAYFGIEAAKNLDVYMHDSTMISKDSQQTKYDARIQFINNSFVPLSIGDTSYSISVNGEFLGTGKIKPFIIGPYGTVVVESEFTGINEVLDRYDGKIPHEQTQLTGKSNYSLYLTTLDVPFNHNPTEDQVKKFSK
ncbi:MAG: hypothetical protein QXU32_01175 [Nitrososphaerales archaeon]